MADFGSRGSLMITCAPEGGYVVSDGTLLHPEGFRQHYYAATTIDEALAYVKKTIGVVKAEKTVPARPAYAELSGDFEGSQFLKRSE